LRKVPIFLIRSSQTSFPGILPAAVML